MGLFDLGFSNHKKHNLFENPFQIGFHVPDSGWNFNNRLFDDSESDYDWNQLHDEDLKRLQMYDMKYYVDEEERFYRLTEEDEDY